MIIRAVHDKENPFFLMRRQTAQDANLSFEARGVLAYLFSKPNDWTLRSDDLREQVARSSRPIGRDKMDKILHELKTHGYLRRVRKRDPGGKIDYDTEIYESPYTAYQGTVHQGTVHQGTVHQGTVHQLLVSRRHIYIKSTKEREQKRETEKEIKQQQRNDQQHTDRGIAAAAAAKGELLHSSHDLADIRLYVEATKRHAKNPAGLAHFLWQNATEDPEITEWFNARDRRRKQIEEAQARKPEAEAFDFNAWIDHCIASGWRAQLEIERAGIIERHGPTEPWEQKVMDFFNQLENNTTT